MPTNLIRLLAFAVLLLSSQAGNAQDSSNTDPIMEELLSMDLAALGQLQVYTASRELTSIEEAPSVVTVITADEIRRRGHKNMRDVLERVPGFITFADNFAHLFGHRGFVEDGSQHYLYMIDGHALNNQLQRGPGQEHLFPRLSHVKRIEIIRSPSSTLWGPDAAAGIIHIITYNGDELDNEGEDGNGLFQITADYEFVNQRKMLNMLYGNSFGDKSDLLVSLNYSESEGDFLPAYHADNDGYVLWPDARPWDPRWNVSGIYKPSYELYAKYRNHDFTLIARHAKSDESRPQFTKLDGSQTGSWTRKQSYLDLRYAPQLSRELKLETSLFYDDYRFGQGLDITDGTGFVHDYDYRNYGASAILTHTVDDNRLKMGVEYEHRMYDKDVFFIIVDEDEDVYGIFIEDTYSGIEDWLFTLGTRYDYNSLRSKGGKLYPRASAFHRIDDNWNVKYAYNTGHVRPSLVQYRTFTEEETFSNIVDGAPWIGSEKPQTTEAHDLQLNYNKGKLSLSVTLFDMTIKDYVTYIGYTAYGNPDPALYGYEYIDQNLGDLNSRGIEIEGSYKASDMWNIYGNISYTKTKLSNRYITLHGGLHTIDIVAESDMDLVNYDLEKTGAPQYIWNLGVDFEPFTGHLFNLHYRGWAENPVKSERQPNEYDIFGPEHFVDINYVTQNKSGDIEFSTYIKNIFDNEAKYPSPNDGGYIVNVGMTYGVGLKMRY